MKFAFIFAIILCVFGYLFLNPRIARDFADPRPLAAADKVRGLISALQIYKLDSQNSGRVPIYPRVLTDLIPQNYISQQDFQKSIEGLPIKYTPPSTSNFDQDHILISVQIPNYMIQGMCSGAVTWHKIKAAEQGAAANP